MYDLIREYFVSDFIDVFESSYLKSINSNAEMLLTIVNSCDMSLAETAFDTEATKELLKLVNALVNAIREEEKRISDWRIEEKRLMDQKMKLEEMYSQELYEEGVKVEEIANCANMGTTEDSETANETAKKKNEED
ncbi:MAG: hypothetical protein LUF35_05935 [Lachnospiraceae bacterium]|nr:hypothetical protein [Lachnospiraceae bacterium]